MALALSLLLGLLGLFNLFIADNKADGVYHPQPLLIQEGSFLLLFNS
jgi:hypothetical protein